MNVNLDNLVGCLCEIRTMDNEFLVFGRINAYLSHDKSIEIVSADSSEMMNVRYGTKVRLKVFSSEHGYLGLEGFVYIAHSSFWRLYDIDCYGDNERRGYFRIKTRSKAEVEEFVEEDQTNETEPDAEAKQIVKYPCIVTSISISGVLIAVDDEVRRYHIGSMLFISNLAVGDSEHLFSLKCCVKRTDSHERLGWLYGCEFVDLNDKEIEKLCQAVFTQQRKEIQRRRGIH